MTLITRTCKCGCGSEFRVMPKNQINIYASRFCDPKHKNSRSLQTAQGDRAKMKEYYELWKGRMNPMNKHRV